MNYKLKSVNKDFLVREVFYEQELLEKENAQYTILWLKKQNINTFDAVKAIADILEIDTQEISYCGLKDEDAISKQQIAVYKILSDDDIKRINLHRDIFATIMGYSDVPLRIGGLHGNVFSITLRNIDVSYMEQLSKLHNCKIKVQSINYYDDQRFGVPNAKYNTHIIGKHIIDGCWDGAFAEYILSGNSNEEKEKMVTYRKNHSAQECFFHCLDNRKISFFLNSYMSELWNKQVSKMVSQKAAGCISHEQKIMRINFIDKNEALVLENNYLPYEYYVVSGETDIVKKSKDRQIVLYTDVMLREVQKDELFPNKLKLRLDFFLPSGSYATMLVKQLFYAL